MLAGGVLPEGAIDNATRGAAHEAIVVNGAGADTARVLTKGAIAHVQDGAAKGAVAPDATAVLAGRVSGDSRVDDRQTCGTRGRAGVETVVVNGATIIPGVASNRAIADDEGRVAVLAVVVDGATVDSTGIPVSYC